MGCSNSKNKVFVGEAPSKSNNVPQPSLQSRNGQTKGRQKSASQRSLGGESQVSDRGTSATSKVSKHTTDSGYEDHEYRDVITEESNPDKIKEVEQGFRNPPENFDLGISGSAITPQGSAQNKERLQEQRILAALHEEGLIQRPVARTSAGISFEVVADDSNLFGPARPPPRLAKLETIQKKKKKELTQEQIAAKLERAEARRLAKEQERLKRVKEVTYKHSDGVVNSQENQEQELFAQFQREKTKLDVAQENRERQLEERRGKQRRKQERLMVAKQRKLAAAAAAAEEFARDDETEEAFGAAKPKLTEDSIIVVKPVDYDRM